MTAPSEFLRRLHPGTIMAAALAAIFIAAFGALLRANDTAAPEFLVSPYVQRLLVSASIQASISTLLAMGMGIFLALALVRMRNAALRRSALALLAVATALPGIVVIFAVVAVYGRTGWASLFLPPSADFSIYGLHGIVVAHVALNGPLAARIFYDALQGIPPQQMRLAAVLRFTPVQIFRFCDWPVLKRALPGVAVLVFLLCFTSFAIVLALGGGPRNATLEVAIYELIRVEADFSRAAMLALLQIAICGFIVAASGFSALPPIAAGNDRMAMRPDAHARGLKIIDGFILVLASVFLLPFLAATLNGLRHFTVLLDADVGRAIAVSLLIAIPAAAISTGLALAIAFAARHARYGLKNNSVALVHGAVPLAAVAVPPFALVAGLYVALRPIIDPSMLGWLLVPLINGVMALPFVYRLLESPLMVSEEKYGRVGTHLNLHGIDRFRIMDWPAVRRPFVAATAMALALSLGDFGVATLFGMELRTLPLLLHERLGAYRLEEAGAIASALVLLVVGLSFASEYLGHADDQ